MPGFVLHIGAVITCPEGGTAAVVPTPPRVLVSGMAVATLTDRIVVGGCTLPTPHATIQWAMTAARVLVGGQPVLVQMPPTGPGNGACLPAPVPPVVSSMQVRVSAS
jgi:hypothetical protein